VPVLALWFVDMNEGKGTKAREALRGWSDMRLKQLDGWFENREFIATDEFTVADILMTAWKKTFDAYCERVEAG
jgi:glutathione S-transferase